MKLFQLFCILVLTFSSTVHAAYWTTPVSGTATVYEVVDGDTMWINLTPQGYSLIKSKITNPSKQLKNMRDRYNAIKVRIGSINTAESKHKIEHKNTKEGFEASAFLSSRVKKGDQVSMHCYDWGWYGRPICNIEHYGKDIAELMIESGHSKYITRYGKNPVNHEKLIQY